MKELQGGVKLNQRFKSETTLYLYEQQTALLLQLKNKNVSVIAQPFF